jgi:HSP20 family protein
MKIVRREPWHVVHRWNPLGNLRRAERELNRLFDQGMRRFRSSRNGRVSKSSWAPALDVYETDHQVLFQAELPGVDPKDIDLRIEGNTLFLKGRRNLEGEMSKAKCHLQECCYGSFVRTVRLPDSVDPDKVSAEFHDGILTVTLDKREEAKPKIIPVGSGSEESSKAAAARG